MRNSIRLCVSLDEASKKTLRELAEAKRQTQSQVVRDALEFYKANSK